MIIITTINPRLVGEFCLGNYSLLNKKSPKANCGGRFILYKFNVSKRKRRGLCIKRTPVEKSEQLIPVR